ncbi:SsgA family sporulation/cell division regulator [Streptomyces sp. Tue6028]|uniref:SsgA family sporulation/cell division regulator n=1 Tax=Streptomyces sp. Tue6028 TaxID=2036037 RepID=UPI003EBC11D4
MKSSRTVNRGLSVELLVSHETALPIDMSLQYEPVDPYAVCASFTHIHSEEPVKWIIARDLLIDGLSGPVGEGDVRIWPACEHDRRYLHVSLNPPTGTALFKVPAEEVEAFLRETEAVVPRGSESAYIDSDSLLAHLLAGG